jgi:hypothetical protein
MVHSKVVGEKDIAGTEAMVEPPSLDRKALDLPYSRRMASRVR